MWLINYIWNCVWNFFLVWPFRPLLHPYECMLKLMLSGKTQLITCCCRWLIYVENTSFINEKTVLTPTSSAQAVEDTFCRLQEANGDKDFILRFMHLQDENHDIKCLKVIHTYWWICTLSSHVDSTKYIGLTTNMTKQPTIWPNDQCTAHNPN